jgi:cell shape-determining protein MreD
MKKTFIEFILILFIIILQISLPLNLNLVLSIILFITIILNFRTALKWGLISGLLLDLYSPLNFGIITLTLFATILIVDALFNNFFTNRSFFSLIILGLSGNLIYNILIIVLNFVCYFLRFSDFSIDLNRIFLKDAALQIIFNLICLSTFFIIFNIGSKKLKSVFITE